MTTTPPAPVKVTEETSIMNEAAAAVERMKAREGENIDEWATNLAKDFVAAGESEYGPRQPEEKAAVFKTLHVSSDIMRPEDTPENILNQQPDTKPGISLDTIKEKERILKLLFNIRDKENRSLDWCNALNKLQEAINNGDNP